MYIKKIADPISLAPHLPYTKYLELQKVLHATISRSFVVHLELVSVASTVSTHFPQSLTVGGTSVKNVLGVNGSTSLGMSGQSFYD